MQRTSNEDRPATHEGHEPSSTVPDRAPPPPAARAAAARATLRSEPSIPVWLARAVVAVARAVNPAVLSVAGRRGVPIAVVHHLGRRSGRRYATPVVAVRTGGGFVVSLPYGSGVDWCRNVLAGGASSVRWQGSELVVAEAQVVGPAEALPLFPNTFRPVVRLARLRQFLRLRVRRAPRR
jgi:deazaflavin-dependent oxidoreductase (nitroreductase family)